MDSAPIGSAMMSQNQKVTLSGTDVTASEAERVENFTFSTAAEAESRYKFVAEAMTWIGTPFRDCADVKGRNGAVDCAMMMARAAMDSGLLPPFDPRPYSPAHMQHSSEQLFIGWLRDKLGAHEVEAPSFGDVVVWQFGRCFCHGGILINSEEVVHAYKPAGCCLVSRLDESLLKFVSLRSYSVLRPVKYFSMWGAK